MGVFGFSKVKSVVPVTDQLVEDARSEDIVIVLMGATGAGKSTFINTLMGKEVAAVGQGMRSQTKLVQHFHFPHPDAQYSGRRILVVDTPGFDDTSDSDEEILERIATWLAASYQDGKKHAGLIYLHDISHNRMEGSKRITYEVFEKLCGEEGATKVVLATTMWCNITVETGEAREKELKGDFWSDMFSRGSTVHRVDLTQQSALEIIDSVLSHEFDTGVAIQKEMIDEGKDFIDTKALKHLQRLKGHGLKVEIPVGNQGQDRGTRRFVNYFKELFRSKN